MNAVGAKALFLSAILTLSCVASALAQDASRPNPSDMVARAQAFELGRGAPQDFDAAVALYRAAAEAGDPGGFNGLARAYAEGRGVEADPVQALQFFARAAQSDNPIFLYDYGRALELGVGREADPGAAADWFQRASDSGFLPATTSLGVLAYEGRGIDRDTDRAFLLFQRAAEGGDARAQNNLGLMYSRGEDVERNYELAAQLFTAAANQGLPEAMRNLSVLYENGHGVEVNEELAADLLRQARMAGAEALESVLEAVGLGFSRHLATPDWSRPPSADLIAAARAGDPVALYVTGYQLLLGAGVRADPIEGEARLQASASKGMASARLALGLSYARGSGVPQDYEQAYFWLSLASIAQIPEAITVRDALIVEMSPEAISRAQSRVRQHVTRSEG